MRVTRVAVVVAAAAAALAPSALAGGGPRIQIGATEDAVRAPTLAASKAQMDLLKLAGFRAVRVSQVWPPGQSAIDDKNLEQLENVVTAAKLDGIDVILTVTQFGSSTTPLTAASQTAFSRFAGSIARALPTVQRFIVGNEPNLNRYWLPQFNSDGSDAAAQGYERLLAQTYDALKAVNPDIEVIGGAVSPRGNDQPNGTRLTHSPTTFIRDLGAAYRASGRTLPIMDTFAFHPYEDNSSVAPVDGVHPTTTTVALADYNKLVALLGEAFDGTAQKGSTLPILYDEFGVETLIPSTKRDAYTGREPTTTLPVDEATQAAYYRQALTLTFCQPNVEGIFLFHSVDERDLDRWQSGLYYTDGTPKASLAPTKQAISEFRRGVITQCPGLQLVPNVAISYPHGGRHPTTLRLRVTCDIDCNYTARLRRVGGRLISQQQGQAVGTRKATVLFDGSRLRAGRYQVQVSMVAPTNPGPPVVRQGPVIRITSSHP
jgi:hypothetical protein